MRNSRSQLWFWLQVDGEAALHLGLCVKASQVYVYMILHEMGGGRWLRMRDQLDDCAHLHPPHASHAPVHPVLSVEGTKGEDICALLLQVARRVTKNILEERVNYSLAATRQGSRSLPGKLLLFPLLLPLA